MVTSPSTGCPLSIPIFVVWIGLFMMPLTSARAQEALEAYMTVARGVQKIDLQTGETEMLFELDLYEPLGIALDTMALKMYWVDTITRKILRANYDGSEIEDVITTLPDQTRGLAIDPVDRYMYWSEWGSNRIVRATLDGENIEIILTELRGPDGIAIDPLDQKIYWNDDVADNIYRANLDGTGVEMLAYAGRVSTNITLHLEEEKMYWVEGLEEKVFRANLNGTEVEEIISGGMDLSGGIVVDPVDRKLYVAEWGGGPGDFLIHRSNLDGTELEEFLFIHLTNIQDMVLDPVSRQLFWTDSNFNRIQRIKLDGTGKVDLINREHWPMDVALDPETEKLYWTDLEAGNIWRSNLDGSELEAFIEGLNTPAGIAIDLEGSMLYWTSMSADQIYRANLDGTNIESLINTTIDHPGDIALDLEMGKMYWETRSPDKFVRANLDGSALETLVDTGLGSPRSIALDPDDGHMYWIDRSPSKIQRATIDGAEVEDLVVSDLSSPYGIALDLYARKMYWTEGYLGKLKRANLDGSEVEEVNTELVWPRDMILRAGTPPQITSSPASIASVGKVYEYQIEASGFPDPVFSLDVAPAGMEIIPATGLVTWVPADTGRTLVIVRAANGVGPDNTQAFELISNIPPLITSFPVLMGTTGQPYRYEVIATGVPAVMFSLTVSPEGMEINDTTGVITWDPVVFGAHDVTVLVRNGTPPDVTQNYTLNISSGVAFENEQDIPGFFGVLQNFPNPFNGSTSIEYRLPNPSHVDVEIYDVLGRRVDVLTASQQSQGIHQIVWDGRDLEDRNVPAGVYFVLVQIDTGERQMRAITKIE